VLIAQDHDFGLIAAELGEFDIDSSAISTIHHQVRFNQSPIISAELFLNVPVVV
jgi:hypothetical protein